MLLANTVQDQQWKLSPQSHILFLKVFFDKKHSKPHRQIIHCRNYLRPPRHSFFFWSPPFQSLRLKVVRKQKGMGGGVGRHFAPMLESLSTKVATILKRDSITGVFCEFLRTPVYFEEHLQATCLLNIKLKTCHSFM